MAWTPPETEGKRCRSDKERGGEKKRRGEGKKNKKGKKKKRKMKRKKKKKREKRNIRALKEFSPAFSAAGRIEFSHTDRVRLNSARMGSFMKF